MTKLTNDEVIKIAENLIGTCNVEEPEFDIFTSQQCEIFDDIVFCCALCGWWCSSQDDQTESDDGEWICFDCSENE